jgi:hypothetical protein
MTFIEMHYSRTFVQPITSVILLFTILHCKREKNIFLHLVLPYSEVVLALQQEYHWAWAASILLLVQSHVVLFQVNLPVELLFEG